jgi:hypothetical protein
MTATELSEQRRLDCGARRNRLHLDSQRVEAVVEALLAIKSRRTLPARAGVQKNSLAHHRIRVSSPSNVN